jgi:hypothetical protein
MCCDGVSHPLDHTNDDRNLMFGWWNWPDVLLFHEHAHFSVFQYP